MTLLETNNLQSIKYYGILRKVILREVGLMTDFEYVIKSTSN